MRISLLFLSLLGFSTGFSQTKPTFATPDWSKNRTIYEVNVRQFSKDGTFKAVEARLTELRDLGVGILWLMPVNPIGEFNRKGSLGSYYAVRNYTGINPEFGTEAHFRDLVDQAHRLGMKVIIDWVANHTSWDHPWVRTNPDFYTKNAKGEMVPPVADWADVADLNYDNALLRTTMIESMAYWLKTFDIDGFRCDVAGMVPVEFWDSARRELDKIKPVFMLAEASEPELHLNAFDMTYGWQHKDVFNKLASGKFTADSLRSYLTDREFKTYHPANYRMLFITNHDENTWNGNEYKRLGDAYNAMTVLTFTLPGMPLIYNGQEAGMTQELQFFERDPIQWKDHPNRAFFTRLTALREKNPALWSGLYGGNFTFARTSSDGGVFAFTRESGANKLLILVNTTSKEQSGTVRKTSWTGKAVNGLTAEKTEIKPGLNFILKPWDYQIWIAE